MINIICKCLFILTVVVMALSLHYSLKLMQFTGDNFQFYTNGNTTGLLNTITAKDINGCDTGFLNNSKRVPFKELNGKRFYLCGSSPLISVLAQPISNAKVINQPIIKS